MKHDEFIGQVQARARLASRGEAERAARSVLETLAEQLPEGLAENLSAQLPMEIGEHLRRASTGDPGAYERLDRSVFISRVSERSGADEPTATFQIHVVLEVVGEAVGAGEITKIHNALPADLADFVNTSGGGRQGA